MFIAICKTFLWKKMKLIERAFCYRLHHLFEELTILHRLSFKFLSTSRQRCVRYIEVAMCPADLHNSNASIKAAFIENSRSYFGE